MRILKFNIFFLLLCIAFFSCNNDSSKKSLSNSVGKYGELLVVIDTVYENGETGEILNNIFRKEVKGLPQIEPMFRMNTVPPLYFSDMLKRARNIIQINISSSIDNNIQKLKNVWAKDQLVVRVNANNSKALNSLLKKNENLLREYFNDQEFRRLLNQFKKAPNKEITTKLASEHNISILIPPAFNLMENRKNDFWIKKEKSIGGHQVIQGIFIYYHPYQYDSSFTSKAMIDLRNAYTYKHIEGMTKNSYMSVYEDYIPYKDTLRINDMYAIEYRGLWNMRNDFMGGPFIHYAILDEKNNRIIHADGFVYAPKFSKREYVRELETILKTIEVTTD